MTTYSATWLDNGGNPWPVESDGYSSGRWPRERFETYAVVDENKRVICVTGRWKEDWERAKQIAASLNFTSWESLEQLLVEGKLAVNDVRRATGLEPIPS